MSWPWSQLGLPGPSDLSEIRHAYAEKLKTTHPEDDPEGFQRLHSAYQLASRMARQRKRQAGPGSATQDERTSRPAPSQAQEEINYDELLQGGGELPHRPHDEDKERDFDYDELLQGGGELPHRPQEEDRERDFDFDELLQEDDPPPRPSEEDDPPPRPSEEEEPDFDFERLFAEGEAERAEARRRRGEERRRAQAQVQAWARERQRAKEWTGKREYWQRQEQRNTDDRERQEQFHREQGRWQNTETVLHTIEMMYDSRAGAEVWKRFFMSPLFQQTKNSLDLIFGLEDFVSTKDLSQEARLALFLAYGFDKGVARPELRPLYQMLLSAWRTEKQDKRQQKLYKIGTCIGGILLSPLILLFLSSGWLLAILLPLVLAPFVLVKLSVKRGPDGKRKLWPLWLPAFGVFTYVCWDRGMGLTIPLGILAVGFVCWVLWQVVKTGSMTKRANGGAVSRKEELRAMLGFGLAVVGLLALGWLRTQPELDIKRLVPTRDPREQTCRYIEQDFGVEVYSLYNESDYYANDTYSNVFCLEKHANRQFLAGPDGERDLKAGKAGYTTNLPEMLLLWELEDFMLQRKIYDVDSLDQGLERWETTGTFLITLPLDEGEDIIRELGELMDELRQKKWYQSLAARCTIVLCSEEMEEGRVVMIRIQPGLTLYSTEQCLGLYEDSFAHSVCAQMIKELELDRDFLQEGEERYTLTNEGRAQLKGHECFKLLGLNEAGAAAMEYYVDPENRNIYCVPGNFWETGNSEEQISFYRLLRWGKEQELGVVSLFYPWIMVG